MAFKTKPAGKGYFNCPNCREKTRFRRYEVVEVQRRLFVPFEGETIETFIVCERCERRMRDEDLRGRMPADSVAIIAGLKAKLVAGESVQGVLDTLTSTGTSQDEARALVNAAAGIMQQKCNKCDLNYIRGTRACVKCGAFLSSFPT